MPMKVRYTSVNGEVIAENRGGVRKLYLSDPLGSTLALADNTQTITDRFTYWPYGEEASRTGATPTPFRFVGTQGYYRDSPQWVCARRGTMMAARGRWMNAGDLAQYALVVYTYADGDPTTWDSLPEGPNAGIGPGDCPGKEAYDFIRNRITTMPGCKAAFNKACRSPKGGFPGKFKLIRPHLEVSDNCLPRFPYAGSGCTAYSGRPDRPCRPRSICFNRRTCQDTSFRGLMVLECLILLETVNWCSCERAGRLDRWTENAAWDVVEACGLLGTCQPGTPRTP